MIKFLTGSIGRKFIMSISGLFLVLFIAVHLTVNLLLIFDDSGELFNVAAHFMDTNVLIKVMEIVLGLGFLVHIVWALMLEYRNWRARPIKYSVKNRGASSSWVSRNMLILGLMVLIFLVIHVSQFFWVIKFNPELMNKVVIGGKEMKDTYTLVSSLFKTSTFYGILYVIGGVLLALHISHGFWSGFHSLGLSNNNWIGRLQIVGIIYAVVVAVGFSIIPLYFMIKF